MKVLLLCLSCFPLLGATFLPALEDSTRSQSSVATKPIPCNPGPWGQLDYYYIYLEAPDHIADLISAPSDRTIWHFPGKTLDEIDAILTTALMKDNGTGSTTTQTSSFSSLLIVCFPQSIL